MNAQKIQQLVLKPWVILTCLVIGFTLGWALPSVGLKLAVVGDIYVDLLKMIERCLLTSVAMILGLFIRLSKM